MNVFFDKENSKALRGFWAIVIILVHIPGMYQNRIQDLIGSFAFVGVTFFFMTSSYGLTLIYDKKNEGIQLFWKKRLPKLVVTCLLTNIVDHIICFVIGRPDLFAHKIFEIDIWVRWLLCFYFVFWICAMLIKQHVHARKIICCLIVAVFSLSAFFCGSLGLIRETTWAPESYGFIWGIALASNTSLFYDYFRDKWKNKVLISCVVSIILGITYLNVKPIFFIGNYLTKIILGLSILVFNLIINVRYSFVNKICLFLGEISFEIYLLQWTAFTILSVLCGNKIRSELFIIGSITLAIIMAFATHFLAKKILCLLTKMTKV